MVDITLFELHLDSAEFTANAPNGGLLGEDRASDESDSGGAPLGLVAVLALVALVGAAVVMKKRGGSAEPSPIEGVE